MAEDAGTAGRRAQRVARGVALTTLFLALTPAAALAATRYAVASGGASSGPCAPLASACDLTTAITQASGGDVVVVEPGTYAVNAEVTPVASPLTIEGIAGQPLPVIDMGASGELETNGTMNVSYLDLERTAGSGEVINADGALDHLLIRGDASGDNLCQCEDGTLTNSVLVNTGADGAAAGINSNGDSGTEHYYNDTFIATQAGGAAIELDLYYSVTTPIDNPTQTFTAQNVIAYNAAGGNDVVVYADNDSLGTSTATITLTDSAYQNPLTVPGVGDVATITNGGGRVTATPDFVDPADGDYAELWNSPTINTGLNDPTDDGSLDFAGLPRSVLGNTDIGAYEYQPLGTASATPSVNSAVAGTAVTFTGAGSDPNPGAGPLSYSWHFDDGASASGAVVNHTFTTAGPHTATLTVSDGSPYTATAQTSVSITAATVTPAAPTLTGVSLSVHQPKPAKGKIKAKRFSAAVSYTLNEQASVNVTITTLLKGKRVSGRCESMLASSRNGKKLSPCPKTKTFETFTLNGQAGANTATFPSGSIPKKLPAGHYRITLTAVNGSTASQPVSDTFTVK